MKNRLRRLTALAGLFAVGVSLALPVVVAHAQVTLPTGSGTVPETAAASPPATDGASASDRLLVEAITRLERRASITAALRHQTTTSGQQLYGVGSYFQQGTGDDLRVRLDLKIGQDVSLSQISNGRFFWSDRVLPTGRTVTRVDLRKLRSDPVLAAGRYEEVRPGHANWSAAQNAMISQCGGVPRLLVGLRDNFTFYPPQAMRLVAPGAAGASSLPYFAVVGRWKPDKLAVLLGSQDAKAASQVPERITAFPERLPQEVLLLFGQADLFPYRIEYRRPEPPPAGGGNDWAPVYQLSGRPTAVLEFSNVAFDVPIAPSQFDYAPPNVDWVDHTAALIEKLRRDRQQEVATRSEPAPAAESVR